MATSSQQPNSLAIPPAPDALMLIIERAVNTPDFDIVKLQQLFELKERHDQNEARKAYHAAMSEFKANPPRILKNARVHFQPKDKAAVDYKHATLDNVCDAVIGDLSKVGLSHRWTMKQDKEWIQVTCILTHALGHSEATSLQGFADVSGSKNPIQAIASTVTYLQRYTLLAACGLATTESDNDGRGATITVEDRSVVSRNVASIMHSASIQDLWENYKAAYRHAEQANDRDALETYIAAKDERKAELSCQ